MDACATIPVEKKINKYFYGFHLQQQKNDNRNMNAASANAERQFRWFVSGVTRLGGFSPNG
jgi:hypothetical protein